MMIVYGLFLIISSQFSPVPVEVHDVTSIVTVEAGGTYLVWECPGLEELEYLPDGLTGFSARGCGLSGRSGEILLPAANLFLAVPPGSEIDMSIVPEGVRLISRAPVARVSVSDEGIDSFETCPLEELPDSWGSISHTGVFRRAGVALLEVHPVIFRDGALYAADRLRIELEYPDAGSPRIASGGSGRIFNALLEGGNRVWRVLPAKDGPSPFWGLPWYVVAVDTAGMYSVNASLVPAAYGTPSSSISMFCGRGMEMGEQPWENAYTPRAVPMLVEDGGDGIFDSGDRIIFFGRSLSWWECTDDFMPLHFNHRFSNRNTYWLTWGSEDGARMEINSGELTGAPMMPDSFLSRYHFEQNTIYSFGSGVTMDDDWAWDLSSGSTDSWNYYSFDSPQALGTGYVRIHLASPDFINHHIRIELNQTNICDTTWYGAGSVLIEVPVLSLQPAGNTLGLNILRDNGDESIYFDWFEVFPWTAPSLSGQSQIPLEWYNFTQRTGFTWEHDLSGSYLFLISGDTLAVRVIQDDSHSFELEIPATWEGKELWITSEGDLRTPVTVSEEAPGRIIENIFGADRLYIASECFYDDIAPLLQSDDLIYAVSASEVYNEFNGGVRDPQAIRAMIHHVVNSWDPIPEDLILVGGGNWDPLHFVSAKESFIDILHLSSTNTVSDDMFAVVGDSLFPQVAVSRIGVTNRSDLQLVVDRTMSYLSDQNRGEWQTVVLGAADDERSPLHGGDESYHTQGMERLLTERIPDVLRPAKMYMIFYDWNDIWKKPLAREDYLQLWGDGALLSLYLGHGGFDQIADEGLLYLEDVGLLSCDGRLPVAMFGSCDVGGFQNPSSECIAQQITTSLAGGAILGFGATGLTSGPANETLLGEILDVVLTQTDMSVGMCTMLGKMAAGYHAGNASYILFGDGSIHLAYPWDSFTVNSDTVYSGEWSTVSGIAEEEGLILIESFESCQPDTYYTFRQHDPIGYLSLPGSFFRGSTVAMPDFISEMFVPLDSDTGSLARTQLVFLSDNCMAAATTYPAVLQRGNPQADTSGPEIELWIEGYRNMMYPQVSGAVTVRAVLSDESGINLLGNTGRQLALYIDGTPQDVSKYFRYNQGSGTTGELKVGIGTLDPGSHQLQLRASDGLLNTSTEILDFSVTSDNAFLIENVFPYPNPCIDGVSINWTQTSPGAVDISIFTLAGRRVMKLGNIEGEAGYNQCWWNCMDADGDMVASGSYIFQISSMTTSTGGSSKITGIIAILRGLE